jgi:hypothetical protein
VTGTSSVRDPSACWRSTAAACAVQSRLRSSSRSRRFCRLKKPAHLGNWFDLIGGTSTGAIIAGALAMGFTTADIKRFYFELAPKVFKRPFWRVLGLQAKYDARDAAQRNRGDCRGSRAGQREARHRVVHDQQADRYLCVPKT